MPQFTSSRTLHYTSIITLKAILLGRRRRRRKTSKMAPTIPMMIFFVSLLHGTCKTASSTNVPNFPTVFFFGDSILDTGNNNYITTLIRADHYPYGLQFPGGMATGRFSDGKLIPDLLASDLGIKESVPPFLNPNLSGDDLHTGVSFASAGSGYDDLTLAGLVISVSNQIENFKVYKQKLESVVESKEEAEKIVKESLVYIGAGGNDFGLNFYDVGTRSLQFNVDEYQDYLQNLLKTYVQELYNLGCRTIVVAGLPPIGCFPFQMTVKLTSLLSRTCLENENSDSQSYNLKLQNLLTQLQQSLPESKILYADIYTPLLDMVLHPENYGFAVTNIGCCGTGLLEFGPDCLIPTCTNFSQYLFWDSVHPGQSAYMHITKSIEDDIFPKLLQNTTA